MGIFVGDTKEEYATACAREIFWTTENVIQVKAKSKFKSVKDNGLSIRQACGVDTGESRAVRAGIRDNSDLIWIGKPPSFAAKLSDVREFPYCTFISNRVYSRLSAKAKNPDGKAIWESRQCTIGGQTETIYRSKWMKTP
jgi:class 3 adenylate cyclase